MAAFKELEFDWSTLCQDPEYWTSSDLQLAAELGKTLLERNKELETSLRQHQNVIEDQTQEIEYLTKQTAALREVNDSRLRIYEQLEVSIQDLERANQRLAVESTNDKKHIKSLTGQVDTLELRCEELQKNLDELTVALEAARRRQRRSICTPDEPESPALPPSNPPQSMQAPLPLFCQPEYEDEMTQLLQQLQEARTQKMREQRKVQDLEEQLALMLQENASLEERLSLLQQKEEDMKSLQEELSMLEEIRQGHLCRRCLRGADERSIMAEEEDEELSVIDSLVDETQRTSVLMQLQESLGDSCQGDNPYRVLVEKYEALLKVQRHPGIIRPPQTVSSNNCLSLQEELQLSGDFSSFNKEEDDVDSEGEVRELPRKERKHVSIKATDNGTKTFSATPTDFSETETSSSGFSDETSNKGTQTDTHFPPGSFLCTISDGDDCKFSIYDDASPVESRFRKTPEYRQLFREIFAVLKRAAEAKDEGEKLPLLDDYTPICEEAPKVPPVTPAKEDAPHMPDSEDSVEASLLSETNSEELCCSNASTNKVTTPAALSSQDKVSDLQNNQTQESTVTAEGISSKQDPDKKKTKDILEYLSGVNKKKGAKKHSTPKASSAVPDSATQLVGVNSKVSYSNKVTRRKKEPKVSSSNEYSSRPVPDRSTWCVSGNDISPSNLTNGTNHISPKGDSPAQRHSVWDVHQTFTSSASHEVAKLKMLEKSYAEVLRLGRQKNSNRNSNSHHRK